MKFSVFVAAALFGAVQAKKSEEEEPQGFSVSKVVTEESEEAESGKIYIDSTDIELTYDDFDEQGNQKVGLRFSELAIPQGAQILEAYLVFICDEEGSGPSPRLQISAEAQDNSEGFTEEDYDISSRTKTDAKIEWSDLGPWNKEEQYSSPDVGPIVQEVVSRDGWNSGNALTILINKFDGDNSLDTRIAEATTIQLEVVYGTGPPVTVPTQSPNSPTQYPTAFPTSRPTVGVYLVDEDSEEGETGKVWDDSSDLELCYDSGYPDEGNLKVALRFTEVMVPNKAYITKARLIFEADESSDEDAPKLAIYGEDEGYSERLRDRSMDISDREKTKRYVSWTPEKWKSGREYESPDLTEIVEEIVYNKEWEEGNAMTFIIELYEGYEGETDTKTRVAEAGKTRLEIEYEEYKAKPEVTQQPEVAATTPAQAQSSLPFIIGGASAGVVLLFATSMFVYKRRKASQQQVVVDDEKVFAPEL